MPSNQEPGLTSFGKLISGALVIGVVALGAFVFKKKSAEPANGSSSAEVSEPSSPAPKGLSETQTSAPSLSAPEPYRMENNTLDVDISEYPGYAGIIAANGGLEPTENSIFFKNSGFKVRLKISEEESWNLLQTGKVGVSVTTTDVLAVLGKQFAVSVPLLIGYSRGADGIVVQNDIKRLNQLQGKIVAATQFTETDFFVRYLAQEAGIGVNMMTDLNSAPEAGKINMVYGEDGEVDSLFLDDLQSGKSQLAGAAMWAPETDEVVAASKGKARMLTTNRNLLIISDIAVANRAFAQQNPKIIAGLVEGWLEGNRLVRANPEPYFPAFEKAFKWTAGQSKIELAKVHLANLPENLAYFSGDIDAAGSFGGIYQSAVSAYGSDLIPDAPPFERFMDVSHLKVLQEAGKFAQEKIDLAPIKSAGGSALENDPLLTKDIRFYFNPNSFELVQDNNTKDSKANTDSMTDVTKLVRVSPGSTILLMGHVDDSLVAKFSSEGPTVLNKMRLQAIQLSKDRANSVRTALVEKFKISPERIITDGKGWDKPVSKTNPEQNRRVEVQWFTVE